MFNHEIFSTPTKSR